MDKAQHTPGPWVIGTWSEPHSLAGHPHGLYTDKENQDDEADICRICEIGAEGEDWANARLIKAAPKLLAACEEYIKAKTPFHGYLADAMIRRAIKEAVDE